MAGVAVIGLFLLAMPAWGQFRPLSKAGPKQYGTDLLTIAALNRALDDYADTLPLYEWVTVEEDSANVGVGGSFGCRERPAPCSDAFQGDQMTLALCYEQWHEWAYGPSYCQQLLPGPGDYKVVSSPPCLPEAELTRQRICRHCLRHEWQVRLEMAPPPSAFDSLKARLR